MCISQETVILESFFNASTNHGPTKFLIFSLLIPYIHREGKVGQQARDALLLIMTISARNPHIGLYIAENSDFCPVGSSDFFLVIKNLYSLFWRTLLIDEVLNDVLVFARSLLQD